MGHQPKVDSGPQGLCVERNISPVTADVRDKNFEGNFIVGRKLGISTLGHSERENSGKELHRKVVNGRHGEGRATRDDRRHSPGDQLEGGNPYISL